MRTPSWPVRRSVEVYVIAVAFLTAMLASAAEPAESELPGEAAAVLNRFAGDWQTEATIRRPGPPIREITTRGNGSCKATLRGRYFEFRTETVPAGQADLQVMTYDTETGRYQQWVFSSDGYRHQAEGTWDAATSTLTWKGKTPDGGFVIEDRWASHDKLVWSLRRTDDKGRVVQTIDGTLTRMRKEP